MGPESAPSLYDVLGVPRDATRTDIKTAWMRGVRLYHPDMGGDTADEEKFQAVQEAYDVLSSEESRATYDDTLPEEEVEIPVTPTGEPDTAPGWDGSPPAGVAPQAYASRDRRQHPDLLPSYATSDGFRAVETLRTDTAIAPWRLRVPKNQHINLVPGWIGAWGATAITSAVTLVTWQRTLELTGREPLAWLPLLTVIAALVLVLGGALTISSRWRRKMSHAVELAAMAASGLLVWVAAQTPEPGTAKSAIITAGTSLVFSAALAYSVHRWRAVSRVLSRKQAKEFRLFGNPGGHATTATQRIVQISTAEKAHEFLDLPNTKVAHHVRIPVDPKKMAPEAIQYTAAGAPVSVYGAVDTAVLAGNRLLLMDSAVVPAGDYSVGPDGVVAANGVPVFHASITTLATAREAWQRLLGRKVKVEAVLVLYPDGEMGQVLTEGLPVAILGKDKAFAAAGKFITDDIRTVDRRWVNELYARTSG